MRKIADPTARLAALREARKAVKKGEVFNADDMAAITGQTWRNLKPQVDADPGWPILKRGAEGVAWQFDGRAVLDHMIAGLEAQAKARDERERRKAELAGIHARSPEKTGLTVGEYAEIDRMQTAAQRRKIEQRVYTLDSEHRQVVTLIFSTVQNELLAAPSRLDAAGQWSPEIRANVADALRTLAVRIHDQVKDKLTEYARPADKPRSRSRAPSTRRVLPERGGKRA